jgi:hypothetical protein
LIEKRRQMINSMRDIFSPKEDRNVENNIKTVFALVVDITDDSMKQLDHV